MAAAAKIEIHVGAHTQQAKDAINSFTALLQTGANKWAEAFRTGIGVQAMQSMVNQLNKIPQALENATKRGIGFNRNVEDATLGIAAVLRQFDKVGEFKTFNDAMRSAEAAIESLKIKAVESPASFQELVRAFQATAGAATAARIPLQKQVDLVVLMSQALAGIGIRGEQIVQESRALLTGNITEDAAAAKMLEITKEQIVSAKEAGRLFEFLTERMSAFSEAGKVGAQNFSQRLSALGDTIDQVLGKLTKPIFETLKRTFNELAVAVSNPAFSEGLSALAARVDSIVAAGAALARFSVEHVEALALALQGLALIVGGSAIGGVIAGLLGLKAGFLALGASLPVAAITAFLTQLSYLLGLPVVTVLGSIATGIASITTVLWLGVEAWRAWHANRENSISEKEANTRIAKFAESIERVIRNQQLLGQIDEKEAVRLEKKLALIQQLTDMNARLNLLSEMARSLDGGRGATPQKIPTVPTPIPVKDNLKLIEEINKEYNAAVQSRLDLASFEHLEKLALIDADVSGFSQSEALKTMAVTIYEKKRAEIVKEESEKARQAKHQQLQRDLQAQADQLRVTRDSIALSRAMLDADFRTPELKKRGPRQELLQKELQELDEIISKLKQKRGLENDAAAKESITQQINSFESDRRGVASTAAVDRASANPLSFLDQFAKVMSDIQNRWGAWASQMANSFATVFNGAIGTVSSNLTGILMRTQSVGEGLRNMWMGITEMVIQEIVRMGVQWFATHVVMKGISAAWFAFKQALFGAETASQAAHSASRTAIAGAEEAGKTTATIGGAVAREGARVGETASEGAHAAVRTGAHAGSEGAKTGATFFGAIARGAIRVGETIFHGIQCGVRLVTYIASEVGMTISSMVNTALRLPLILAQTTAFLVLAGIMAMSALAGIPVVGPFLAIAALAAIIAAGLDAMGAFFEGGFTGRGDRRKVAGVVHNEEFVVNAAATDAIGVENLEAMQENPRGFFAGLGRLAREARGVDRVVVAGLARPDYAGSEANGESGGAGGGSFGGGASPVVNLPRPQVHMAILNNRDEMRAFLESAAGEQLIVDVMNKRRLDFGLGT